MRAILTYQGFTETARRKTDTETLYYDLIRNFSSRDVHTRPPENWNADVKIILDQLVRNGITRIAQISFSHGQAAATATARYAERIGLQVDLWLACDPVYRPTWLPRKNILQPLAFRALLRTGTIHVPPHIQRTHYVRQEINRPAGHTLKGQNVHLEDILPYTHSEIDGSPQWWNLVRDQLTQWTQSP